MNSTLTRRTLLTTAAGIGLTGVLAACSRYSGGTGGSTDSEGGSGETVRFTFWGSDFRFDYTDQMVKAFMAADSGVTVEQEPGDWGGYWDRLATQTAGSDEPDVINMDGKYLAEYAGRGVLADLEQLDIDLSAIAPTDLDSGRLNGTLYALSTGQNAWVLFANPAIFEAAGVDLPDDTTWTWDDMKEIAQQISDSDADAVGITGGGSYADLTIWARQNGEDMWAEDGMATSPEVLEAWYQWYLDLQEAGATLNASQTQEESTLSLEQQTFTVGKAGLTWAWTNTLGSIRETSGRDDITLLRPPSIAGSAAENGLYGKASMYWTISARSEVMDASARLVDFLVNDPEANSLQLLDRGVPSNPAIVQALQESGDLGETDTYVVDFMTEVLGEIDSAPAVQPTGASTAPDVLTRYLSDVRFEKITPADAATATIEEIDALVVTD